MTIVLYIPAEYDKFMVLNGKEKWKINPLTSKCVRAGDSEVKMENQGKGETW